MNILLVSETYLPFIAGVSTSTDSIARFMVSLHHTVTLICPTPILPNTLTPLVGLTIIHTPAIADIAYRGKSMTPFPLALPILLRTLKSQHFDIVHIQEPGSIGICALLAAHIYTVPTVGALHFTPDQVARMITGNSNATISWLAERYIYYIYNRYAAIMVPTQTFAAYLQTLGIQKRIQVVSNGVNTDIYRPASKNKTIRTRYGITSKQTVFLFIGRIDKDKNVRTLIEAMRYVQPETKLIIAGNGKEKEELMAYATRYAIDTNITWLGSITEPQMIELYHAADCFTIMSEFEIQSIVTLQAIASGLPILAAKAGALPELAQDEINGYTVATHDAQALARKMDYLSNNPAIRIRMGKESRKISLAHHKPTALAHLATLYEDIRKK